ncbi:MAG: hypothetical protein AAF639_37245 [Chloroflexota bacterium]
MRHKDDFQRRGITTEQIPDLIIDALMQNKIIGYQIKRSVYQVFFHGQTYLVAITVANNGFIVGANPATIEVEED